MSGANVPYQLRPNKAVERFLWLEALEHINKVTPLKDSAYVSMGGIYLEDFKLVHSRFAITKLFSLEMDPVAHRRQFFNRPLSLIECLPTSTGDFITNFGNFSRDIGERQSIFWFDYASPRERMAQLQETQALVAMLEANDIVKITLNADTKTLGDIGRFSSRKEFQEQAVGRLRSQLADYCPKESLDPSEITSEGFAKILARAVKIAFQNGLAGIPEFVAVPLCCFRYSDGLHQMLTVAAIILEVDEQRRFETKTKLSSWGFRSKDWTDVHEVNVPDLTVKERMAIDEAMFVVPIEEVHGNLPFKLASDEAESLKALKDYELHYRRYPQFLRVNL